MINMKVPTLREWEECRVHDAQWKRSANSKIQVRVYKTRKSPYCGVPLWIVWIFRNNPLIILCFIGVINYFPLFPCAHQHTYYGYLYHFLFSKDIGIATKG
jgi:hypothetical protein